MRILLISRDIVQRTLFFLLFDYLQPTFHWESCNLCQIILSIFISFTKNYSHPEECTGSKIKPRFTVSVARGLNADSISTDLI